MVYGGKTLESGKTYYWKVRYWGKEGRTSDYSKPEELSGFVIQENGPVMWESGHSVSGDPGIAKAVEEANDFAFDVGSGEYSFRLTGQ